MKTTISRKNWNQQNTPPTLNTIGNVLLAIGAVGVGVIGLPITFPAIVLPAIVLKVGGFMALGGIFGKVLVKYKGKDQTK